MPKLKKLIKFTILFLLLGILSFTAGILTVFWMQRGTFDPVKVYDYGVVFGAAIRSKGRLSGTLESRMLTAIRLYREGSVKKLILSGAVKNQIHPGEPRNMFDFAVSHGVNPHDLILDEEGDDTLATISNTHKIQKGRDTVLFVSSFFHLARIQMTAEILGLKNFDLYPSEINHPKVVYFVFRESAALWYYLFRASFFRVMDSIRN